MKIVADDKIPFLKGVLEPFAEVIYLPGSSIKGIDLTDADALLIRTRTRCNESLLKGTKVKFIGTATIGFDHIDTGYCEHNNIKWTNAPGCNSSSVQQYIAAALLKLSKDHNLDLKKLTIGIVGAGNVGSKVEKIARSLGMSVLVNDPPRERRESKSDFVSFDTIMREANIITLHVPLNLTGVDKTLHLFNDESFQRAVKNPWFINSSRGEVVETQAVKRALRSGLIKGAILDVWQNEPDIDPELLSEAFIATPHIAGYSTDGKANGTSMVVDALSRHFNLPLTGWYPKNVPPPEVPVLEMRGTGRSDEDIVREAVMHTYDISLDDVNLRESLSTFEIQRGEYRLRREFHAYTVRMNGGSVEMKKILEDFGFKVEICL
ncbi:MAG: 4-phosphoerythronate dehydrogenase PdxB [Bacteroidia bacterium]|nr:4-phosphoerythronate dehydrogenase PdxB [Bacteroidia bacterium]